MEGKEAANVLVWAPVWRLDEDGKQGEPLFFRIVPAPENFVEALDEEASRPEYDSAETKEGVAARTWRSLDVSEKLAAVGGQVSETNAVIVDMKETIAAIRGRVSDPSYGSGRTE